MGEILWNTGDLYGAQENLVLAINTLDPLNEAHHQELGYAYNILGNVSLELKHYDEALALYNKAIGFAKDSRDTPYIYEIMNGKATVLQKKGSYDSSIAVYDSMLAINPNRQDLLARIIDNRAKTKWLLDSNNKVLPAFLSALKIRSDNRLNLGLSSSYAHLADYYFKVKPDSALWYTQKMYEKSKENRNPVDMLDAVDKFIRLSTNRSSKDLWYREFKELNDSIQFSRDTTRNRFAEIRYNFQKEKANSLELQQHLTRQQAIMYSLIAVALAIIIALSVWYDKRRKSIKRESENAIRDSKFKTSQKVHDVVANGLYTIMNELEHRKTIDREPLMSRIETLYEKSRDISYEDAVSENHTDYDNQVHELLNSFSNDETNVFVVGNQPSFWSNITDTQKNELLLALKEIMVNMKKHSGAKNVVIVFKHELNKAVINYKDNGVGFPADTRFGNGLNNTVNRIKSLKGEISFGKSEMGGVSIEISFPLQSNKI